MVPVIHMEARTELGNVLQMVHRPIHNKIVVVLETGGRRESVTLKIILAMASENLIIDH